MNLQRCLHGETGGRPVRATRAIRLLPALIALAAVISCSAEADHPQAEKAPLVVVTRPEVVEGGRVIEIPGSFHPYEQALLHAKVTGYVSDVNVDIGDQVKKNDVLIRLHLPETEAQLREARAAAELARVTSHRLSTLRAEEPMAVTQQDVDVAAAEEKVASAKVQQLKALMDYAVIRAPFDGMVARRLVDPGALVVSGYDGGDPVLEVARADRLRLVLAIPEAEVPEVKPGVKVRVTVDLLRGRIFEGKVARVSGALAQDTRTMRAEIDMDAEGGLLRPGMYATVRLQLETVPNALSLPSSVVHQESEHAFVWTVREGSLRKAAVEIVRDDGERVIISAGLDPETRVLLAGPQNLQEGQAVRLDKKNRREDDRQHSTRHCALRLPGPGPAGPSLSRSFPRLSPLTTKAPELI